MKPTKTLGKFKEWSFYGKKEEVGRDHSEKKSIGGKGVSGDDGSSQSELQRWSVSCRRCNIYLVEACN